MSAKILMLLSNEYRPDPRVRKEALTLHEAGHAYDSIVKGSQDPIFQAAYFGEAGRVPKEMRQTFAHFLQEGNKGPVECFASLFARKYWRDPDALLARIDLEAELFAKALTTTETKLRLQALLSHMKDR